MRTTLALDEDVFKIARQKAQRDHVSIGAAVCELMREGIRSMQQPAVQLPTPRRKYAVLPARDEIITSEHVYKRMEQEDT
jgi:hypothetical protein